MTAADHLDRLTQRRNWLTARIGAKQSIGWDVDYDTSERPAPTWAIAQLHRNSQAPDLRPQ